MVDGDENTQLILSKTGESIIITPTDSNPRVPRVENPPLNVNLNWLLNTIKKSGDTKEESNSISFTIDRNSKKCFTPRRNPYIDNALTAAIKLQEWTTKVNQYLQSNVFNIASNIDVSMVNSMTIFNPVLPLFEGEDSNNQTMTQSLPDNNELLNENDINHRIPLINSNNINNFLQEQKRSLEAKSSELRRIFPSLSSNTLITGIDATLSVTLQHMSDLTNRYVDSMDFIEDMIRKQLVSAIGKVVTPTHFSDYMIVHNRKLFNDVYQPRAFTYSVRRTDSHSPEGTISIEQNSQVDNMDISSDGGGGGGSSSRPIYTIVNATYPINSHISKPMQFSLNSFTKVTFGGSRYVHGWLGHRFSNEPPASLTLIAQARQLSNYIVLIGRIASPTLFEPNYAIIIQNKDDIKIPLNLESIPTPKQFRDAIQSLSPKQQEFAKAYRNMQLENTLFGICIIQIKPHLEKVLNLQHDSLTKEIELTQQLMELFIEYQVNLQHTYTPTSMHLHPYRPIYLYIPNQYIYM